MKEPNNVPYLLREMYYTFLKYCGILIKQDNKYGFILNTSPIFYCLDKAFEADKLYLKYGIFKIHDENSN